MLQTWTGWDGSVWTIAGDPDSPVRLKLGVRGLGMPPVLRYASRSPAVAGARWRGALAEERDVFWPLAVYGTDDWADVDAAFWRTMDPERQGTWTVEHGDVTRRLRCRYVSDSQHTFEHDPTGVGRAVYGITLVAEQPFWEGQPVAQAFTTDPAVPFFGAGAVFHLDPGATAATATIDNPGDVEAWPVYRLEGPMDSAEVGIDGRMIEMPMPLLAGEVRTIDTAPTAQTSLDEDGVDRTDELGEVDFAPVPPGSSVALTLSIVGTGGTVTASLTPLYRRAW